MPALLAIVTPFVKGAPGSRTGALEPLLAAKADDVRALADSLAQPGADATVAGLRARAASALAAGQFAEIERALGEAELHLLKGSTDIAAMPGERRIAAARQRADRGAAALLPLNPAAYREAAQRFGEAAAIVGLADPDLSLRHALAQSEVMTRLGLDFADASGFEAAIAQCRALLSGLDPYDSTLAWAAAQERLGAALEGLAGLTGAETLRDEALACYVAGLDDLRPAEAPALWRSLQQRLGALALALGEAREDVAALETAVAGLRAGLGATPRDAEPGAWARAQRALGCALAALGRHGSELSDLENAFNAFTAALGHYSREADPLAWAEIRDRMGDVLCAMAERYDEPVVLEEAVAAYGAALEERRRETAPLLWAVSSANQGLASMQLARRRSDPALAQQAVMQVAAAIEAMRAQGHGANAAALQRRLAAAGDRPASRRKA